MLEPQNLSDAISIADPPYRQVAVIDIGATSVRMAIGEILEGGKVKVLESLVQPVSLGMESFVTGKIDRKTTERCISALKTYRAKLREYRIGSEQVRVVATSAVREARNRLEFVDRIYTQTGFNIEPFDEAEVHRVTYLGVRSVLAAHPELSEGLTCVIEIGGGSTESLVLEGGDVLFARTFRLGALRLRRTLDSYRAPTAKVREIMENQIDQLVSAIRKEIGNRSIDNLVVMGGEVRLATSVLNRLGIENDLTQLNLTVLESFVDDIWSRSPDELISRYRLSVADAESLGPALLAYANIAREFKQGNLLVANTNMRDGLMKEMAQAGNWSDAIREQIIRSATAIATKYQVDLNHCEHVARLAVAIFDGLGAELRLGPTRRMVLHVAALLHEVGLFVSHRSYHKHSMYLIRHSEFFGLGSKNLNLVAMVSRYHRRASPQPTHNDYSSLNRKDRVSVAKLAGILRVAKALDSARQQRIHDFQMERSGRHLVINVPNVTDISMEQLELRQSCSLFEDVFGLKIVMKSISH